MTYLHCSVLLSSSRDKVKVRVNPSKKIVGAHTAHETAATPEENDTIESARAARVVWKYILDC